tara:strand:+ start:410 stop:1297 length:888 start_codon:yes stop_codon:yes gene_type:complete
MNAPRNKQIMDIRPLEASFGAEVTGVDLSAPLGDDGMRSLTEALYQHRVLVIRDQRLNKEQYLKFGQRWGTPIPHVLDHLRMPGFPALMAIGNTESKDKSEAVRNGTVLWHTDQSYEAVPASATMLYAIKAPVEGGETQVCNMTTAYEELAPEMKKRLASLQVAHQYGRGKLRAYEYAASPIKTSDQHEKLPTYFHPLILNHHVTGKKTLYGVGQSSYAIRGMNDNEATALLEELKDHVLQERFIYRHKYKVGDVAMWDTFQTLHSGSKIDVASCEEDSRLLWRISVRGKPDIYN